MIVLRAGAAAATEFSKLKSMAQNPSSFTNCGGDVTGYGFLRPRLYIVVTLRRSSWAYG
jgi:hypothetical protein